MIPKYLLLLIIPAIVESQISVNIKTGDTDADTKVQISGENLAIISDKERETFNIIDESLKDACVAYSGMRPSDVFVKRPTPWEDVYTKFKWPEVQRILKPVRSRVIGMHSKPVVVAEREFENNSSISKIKYNAAISHEIVETAVHKWSVGGELTVGQDIAYSVNHPAGSLEGSNSLCYSSNFGNETTKAKTFMIGTSTGVEVELAPGQAVVVTLSATHGSLEVEVDYEAYLVGNVFANYLQSLDGHKWWSYPIKYVLMAAGMPNKIMSTERISVGFCSSAKVFVTDKKTRNSITEAPVTVITVGRAGFDTE